MMLGIITAQNRWIFSDEKLGDLPTQIHAAMPLNGRACIQIMTECKDESCIFVNNGDFVPELYQMYDIPVEANTADSTEQGGIMIVRAEHCPDYAVRRAPFRVYDCLVPCPDGRISANHGRAAAYLCLRPRENLPAGEYKIPIEIHADGERHVCELCAAVYPVKAEASPLHQTTWFSLEEMAKKHGAREGTDAYFSVVRAYARAMRRAHMDVFNVGIGTVKNDGDAPFDFKVLKPIIQIFFEEGFDWLETGGILSRGGDMYTADFKCAADPEISADSDAGREILRRELSDFAEFLKSNHWEKRVLFHVIDEPDVYCRSESDLQKRRTQYLQAAEIVRRFLPDVKIMEAVKTAQFGEAIDIMVPITNGYQAEKAAFDRAAAAGKEIWTYVCCCPEGKWLNRFLDQPLINGRLLMWGCEANGLKGYLHWGFNQYGCTPDPFAATRGLNPGGQTDFPCGDAFIVYPGKDGPWLSLRLEAQRQGAEDAMLLAALRKKNPRLHDERVRQVFRAFDDYDNRPGWVNEVCESILRDLSEK